MFVDVMLKIFVKVLVRWFACCCHAPASNA